MNVKLKALGLAMAAAFALSAVAASAASAQTVHSGTGGPTTFLTANQHVSNILHTELGNILCTTIEGAASYSGTTTTAVTVQGVKYSGCTAYGQSADIDMMSCDYNVTGTNATTGIVHIECTNPGDSITITPTQGGVAICHVNVPPQTINLSITNTAETGGGIKDDIDIRPESNITYHVERTAGGSKCPTTGSHSDGNYTNYITVTGFEDKEHKIRTGLTYT